MRIALPEPVRTAIGRLEEAGYPAYAVGGCVRDRVLGMTPHDYDICTAAFPEDMRAVFAGERTVDTGIRHGTLTVILGGMPLEITTFRQDGEYRDGRHPEHVTFTPRVEDDLSRRDFTINAMAYSPARGLIDPFGGREDCKKGVIRCVGEAEKRFEEDSLRILRALRFSARLGFPIEEKTAAAIRRGRKGLRRVSMERIAAEMNGLLLGPHASGVLADFAEVLRAVPPLQGLPDSPAWPAALRRLPETEADLTLRWAALLLGSLNEAEARGALEGLKMPARLTEQVSRLIALEDALRRRDPEGIPVREKMMLSGAELFTLWIALDAADRIAACPADREGIKKDAENSLREFDRLLREDACFSLRQLAVRGNDLAALGYRGREIGEALESLLLRVVRGELPNEKAPLLAAARKDGRFAGKCRTNRDTPGE